MKKQYTTPATCVVTTNIALPLMVSNYHVTTRDTQDVDIPYGGEGSGMSADAKQHIGWAEEEK